MIYKALSTIFIILIPVTCFTAAFLYFNPKVVVDKNVTIFNTYFSDHDSVDIEFINISNVEKKPKAVDDLYIAGWIPEWDIQDGLESIKSRPNLIESVSPIWFFLNEDGTLRLNQQTNGKNQIDFFKENNIELIPSVQEFNAKNFGKVISDPFKTEVMINGIVNQVKTNAYDGIDLDIEAINVENTKNFFDFLSRLSTEMKDINKKLVFTALPKYNDNYLLESYPETSRVQDYKRIADLVDEFRIMTYQYSGPKNESAGPVQPLIWQEQIIKYAISKEVPRDKLVLGVATYSFDWSDRNIVDRIDLKRKAPYSPSNQNVETGLSLFNKDIIKIKNAYKFTEEFNDEWAEAILSYEFNGKKRIVVYPNDKSIELRKQLAADYGIKGIAYWRLGDEGDLKF